MTIFVSVLIYAFFLCWLSLSCFAIKMYWLYIVGFVVCPFFYCSLDELWVLWRFGGILSWIHLVSGFLVLEDLALLFLYNWLLWICLNCCSFNFVGHMCVRMYHFLMDWESVGNMFSKCSLVIPCILLEFIIISPL